MIPGHVESESQHTASAEGQAGHVVKVEPVAQHLAKLTFY